MFSENSQKKFVKQILRIITLQGCWWILDMIQNKSNANLKSAEQTQLLAYTDHVKMAKYGLIYSSGHYIFFALIKIIFY